MPSSELKGSNVIDTSYVIRFIFPCSYGEDYFVPLPLKYTTRADFASNV